MLLRQPCFDRKVLKSRQKLIEFFQTNRGEREAIQTALAKLGKKRLVNVSDFLFKPAAPQPWKVRTYKALSAFAILSPLVLFWSTGLGVLLIVNDRVVATHPRDWARENVHYDPLHYLALLERKPGSYEPGTS